MGEKIPILKWIQTHDHHHGKDSWHVIGHVTHQVWIYLKVWGKDHIPLHIMVQRMGPAPYSTTPYGTKYGASTIYTLWYKVGPVVPYTTTSHGANRGLWNYVYILPQGPDRSEDTTSGLDACRLDSDHVAMILWIFTTDKQNEMWNGIKREVK